VNATIDISLYPLADSYKQTIVAFVKDLRKRPGIRVETDGMRTQVIGDYDDLMTILGAEMKKVLEDNKAVFIIKLAKGERTVENLTAALRDA
jgi:uncharacterized protein YqgV (UPF0045/DUF77 family)